MNANFATIQVKHAIVICPDYDEWGYLLEEDEAPFEDKSGIIKDEILIL